VVSLSRTLQHGTELPAGVQFFPDLRGWQGAGARLDLGQGLSRYDGIGDHQGVIAADLVEDLDEVLFR
jgi:hypothetical protein